MNRYERYKDSGIPWLGEVPAHWDVKKFKHLCKIITGYTPSKNNDENYDENGFLWVKPDNLNDFKEISDTKEKISVVGLKSNYLIPKDSILVCSIGTIGKMGVAMQDVVTNQQINSFIFNELVNKSFSKYLIYSAKGIFEHMANDNVVRILNSNTQKNIFSPLPPLIEQAEIADYLDKETAKIDRLCETVNQTIGRLKEYRTALITQAVTKGLDPAAPMKKSGVEWLGDVPAHWQLINLKFLCRVKGGYAFSSDNFSDEGIPVIRISDILFDGTIDNINCKRIPLELAPNQKDFELRNGQLVMAMTGATIGKISKYCSEDYAYINQRVGKFEAFNSRLNYAFLYHLLNTSGYQEHIKLTAFGGAQPNISDSEMVNYQMALPTMEEQAHIADYLDKETAKIDRLCDTVNQTIDRLKEYRIALITQAVTGKVKVTNE